MCFTINKTNERYKQVLKAENDVVCYKIVYPSSNYKKDEFQSYWQAKLYVVGQTYNHAGTFRKKVGDGEIRKGFHSYKNLKEASKRIGYAIYTNTVMIECLIPAGSLYWENEQEYCSSSLKIVKKILRDSE